MWTDRQFWRDSTWRAFRTFCQSLAGLLTVQQVSSNMNAPWLTLIYASAVAGLISLLQSIDRERAVTGTTASTASPTDAPTPSPTLTDDEVLAEVKAAYSGALPAHGCGESLR